MRNNPQKKNGRESQAVEAHAFNPSTGEGGQRQVDLCEFEANLVKKS